MESRRAPRRRSAPDSPVDDPVTGEPATDETIRLEITGHLDRQAAEALYLEIRRLAKRHGVEVILARTEEVVGDEPEGAPPTYRLSPDRKFC